MKTINEQIKRIKSLFGDERLYGNLNESSILNEQSIGRKLAKSLSTATPLLKSFDSKLLTNFFETEIRNFDDLSKHLDQYEDIWGKVIPPSRDFDFVRDMSSELDRIEKSGKLSEVSEEMMDDILKGIPPEGDLRQTFMDMWLESTGKQVDEIVDVRREVVTDPESGENILKVTDETGEVKSYGSDGKEIKIDGDVSTPKKLDGDEIGESDVVDNTVATTDRLDPNGNPDVNNGEIIEAFENGMKKTNRKRKKKLSTKQISKEIDENGGILYVKGKDGKMYSVSKIDNELVTIDENGKIVDTKTTGSVTLPKSTKSIEKGSKKFGNTKNIDYSNMDKSFGGIMRYMFPITSTSVRLVRFIFKGAIGKGFTKKRFTFFKGGTGDMGKDFVNVSLRQAENLIRLGEEQLFLAYIYGSYKKFEREEESPMSISDYGNKLIDYGLLLGGLWDNLSSTVKSIKDFFVSPEATNQFCKNDCEKKGIPASEVNESQCLKECKVKYEAEKEKINNFIKSVESLSENIEKIKSLKDMDEKEMENFCSGDDGDKEKIMSSLKNFKDGLVDYEKHLDDLGDFNMVLNFLGLETGGKDEILNKLLTPKGETERITLTNVEELEDTINNFCIDYYNRDVNPNKPIENEEGGEDNKGEVNNNIEDRMVYINVSIIPVEITGEDIT